MGFRVIDTHGGLKTSYLAQASEVTITTTGNIDNLDFSNAATIRMNNASLSTIRGLKAGIAGQRVVIVSVGAGQVNTAHQNTNSTAANRLVNAVTSGSTPGSAGVGMFTYEYDATTLRWRLVSHVQGAAISFASPVFTANLGGTFSVASVVTFKYTIINTQMFVSIDLESATIAGSPTVLFATWGDTYTIAETTANPDITNNAGTVQAGFSSAVSGNGFLDFLLIPETAFTNTAGGTSIQGQVRFAVT